MQGRNRHTQFDPDERSRQRQREQTAQSQNHHIISGIRYSAVNVCYRGKNNGTRIYQEHINTTSIACARNMTDRLAWSTDRLTHQSTVSPRKVRNGTSTSKQRTTCHNNKKKGSQVGGCHREITGRGQHDRYSGMKQQLACMERLCSSSTREIEGRKGSRTYQREGKMSACPPAYPREGLYIDV